MFLDVPLRILRNIILKILKLNLIKLLAIDSTNSYLKQMAMETFLPDKTVAVTENQWAGQGQRGNSWVSKSGQSLTFSLYKILGALPASRQFMLSMAVSLGLVQTLNNLKVQKIAIKWPNDILSANKKIGGILIENVLEGSLLKYAIIGVGLNVNETAFPNLPQASSMKMETGQSFQLGEVLDAVVQNIFRELQNLSATNFVELRKRYENHLYRIDTISVFETPNGARFNGMIKGVSDRGELLVETENAQIQKFQLKEVKLIY